MSSIPQWLTTTITSPSREIFQQAQQHQDQLTKPRGALGAIEELAIKLAAMQGKLNPVIDRIEIAVFAADHGIAESGVSAFPQVVTGEMIRNFATGGAAISVLAKYNQAHLSVVDLGTVNDIGETEGVIRKRIASSTKNFMHEAAMTEEQYVLALQAGRDQVEQAVSRNANLFIGGEMGIGNTSSATALACAILDLPASELVGPGTGLDDAAKKQKAACIQSALDKHTNSVADIHDIAKTFGGFEIIALAGACLSAAQQQLTVCVDGFISSVAVLIASKINPACLEWCIFSHQSAEPGHIKVLQALQAKPVLNLAMRLGEGSGAAFVIPLLQQACALHNNMASFADAGVTDSD